MSTFTHDDLRRILTAVAGEDETTGLPDDVAGMSFEDMGYDSLALMEMAARISQEYGVHIGDDQAAEFKTPEEVVIAVNDALGTAARS